MTPVHAKVIDKFQQSGLEVCKAFGVAEADDKVLLIRSMPAGYDQIIKLLQVNGD